MYQFHGKTRLRNFSTKFFFFFLIILRLSIPPKVEVGYDVETDSNNHNNKTLISVCGYKNRILRIRVRFPTAGLHSRDGRESGRSKGEKEEVKAKASVEKGDGHSSLSSSSLLEDDELDARTTVAYYPRDCVLQVNNGLGTLAVQDPRRFGTAFLLRRQLISGRDKSCGHSQFQYLEQ